MHRIVQISVGCLVAILFVGSARLALIAYGTLPALLLQEFPVLVSPEREVTAEQQRRAEFVAQFFKDPVLFPALYGSCPDWPISATPYERCMDRIETILYSNPTLSELWAEYARLQMAAGFNDGAIAALKRSFQTGPNESWISERRVRVAAPMLQDQPALRPMLVHDLTQVVADRALTDRLSEPYSENSSFRDALSPILEDVRPTALSRQFIAAVNRRLRKSSGENP